MRVPPNYADDILARYSALQNAICDALEKIERESLGLEIYGDKLAATFTENRWDYRQNGGGGSRVLTDGRVFEKAGVNVSRVWGEFPKEFATQVPGAEKDPRFWACGISLVIHPRNPYVPITHANTRHIVTTKSWFGGGADLTPVFEREEDTRAFHQAFKEVCDASDPTYYDKFKKWCDEYFFIPHRDEARGVGGIFYDYLSSGDFAKDLAFDKAVGEAFLKIYPEIVRKRMRAPWGEAETRKQLVKRGRYAEFNLMYDRGTRFGLNTGGNIDAILMSLPPLAAWPT